MIQVVITSACCMIFGSEIKIKRIILIGIINLKCWGLIRGGSWSSNKARENWATNSRFHLWVVTFWSIVNFMFTRRIRGRTRPGTPAKLQESR